MRYMEKKINTSLYEDNHPKRKIPKEISNMIESIIKKNDDDDDWDDDD